MVRMSSHLLNHLLNEHRQQVCQHLTVPVQCWASVDLYQVHLQTMTAHTVQMSAIKYVNLRLKPFVNGAG